MNRWLRAATPSVAKWRFHRLRRGRSGTGIGGVYQGNGRCDPSGVGAIDLSFRGCRFAQPPANSRHPSGMRTTKKRPPLHYLAAL